MPSACLLAAPPAAVPEHLRGKFSAVKLLQNIKFSSGKAKPAQTPAAAPSIKSEIPKAFSPDTRSLKICGKPMKSNVSARAQKANAASCPCRAYVSAVSWHPK